MSPTFLRKSIPEQFADKLLSDIVQGRFGALLPSIRELAEAYALNLVSVHKGVTLLVKRGVLVNRGPRRRLAIAQTPAKSTPCGCKLRGVPCCRPLIFVGADPSELNSTLIQATHDIQQASRANGGGCVTVVLAGLEPKAKVAAVKVALLEHKPSHVLLLYCDQEVHELGLRRPATRVAVMGGTVVAKQSAALALDLPLLATAAFADLASLGHRRFRLMMLGRPATAEARRHLREFAAGHEVEAEVVCGGEMDLPTMSRALSHALKEGVTAFALPRPEDYLLAQAYFDTVKAKVPADVSLVMLLSGPYDFMQAKRPAHFKVTKEQIVSLVLGWFEFGENRSERFTREVIGSYVRGTSVGPVARPA